MIASLLLMSSLASAQPSPITLGRQYVAVWRKGDLKALYTQLAPGMQKHFGSYEKFSSFHAIKPVKTLEEKIVDGHYQGLITDASFVMVLDLYFDASGKVSGLLLKSDDGSHAYPSSHDGEVLPQSFRFPFDNETWFVSGAHHRAARSQRYAYDLRVFRNSESHAGSGKDNKDYFSYGKSVLSPVAGTVVATTDGEPDVAPGDESSMSLGNSVTLQVSDKVFLFLTHLQKGVLVRPGDAVKPGQPLGRVGNSGHTTQPHLHIEAFDGLPRETADAYPLYFTKVIHNGMFADMALAAYGDTLQTGGN